MAIGDIFQSLGIKDSSSEDIGDGNIGGTSGEESNRSDETIGWEITEELPTVSLDDPLTVIDSHVCEECGDPVYRKSNRGRWPKRCELHKRSPRTGGAPKGRSPSTEEAQLDEKCKRIAKDVARNIALLGLVVEYSGFAPTAAYMIMSGADEFGANVVDLAKHHPAVLAALDSWSQVGPGIVCARFALGVITAFGVDMGVIAVDALPAKGLGVTHAYYITHNNDDTGTSAPLSSEYSFSAPPSNPFVGV